MRRLVAPVLVVAVLATAAAIIPLPWIVVRPGSTLSAPSATTVGAPQLSSIDGDFLVTTVNQRDLTIAEWLRSLLDDSDEIRPVPADGPPTRAFFAQQRTVFLDSAQVAAAAGLQAAGYDVLDGDGVLVREIVPDLPAEGRLEVGDVILAIGDEPVHADDDLRRLVRGAPAGRALDVELRRGQDAVSTAVTPALVDGQRRLGVVPETVAPRVELPFAVAVEGGRIGGPSGGLMIALTVYDLVTPDRDVAAGRRIAGTGQITTAGDVLPIGDPGLKVRAAIRDGADVFLVPAAQLAEAQAALPPGADLPVLGVTDLNDALTQLTGAAA